MEQTAPPNLSGFYEIIHGTIREESPDGGPIVRRVGDIVALSDEDGARLIANGTVKKALAK